MAAKTHFFESPQLEAAFLKYVRAYFDRRGLAGTLRNGVFYAKKGTSKFKSLQYGLESVAKKCQADNATQWPTIIAEHFDSLMSGEAALAEIEQQAQDFEAVKSRLAVRLWPASRLSKQAESSVVWRRDIPGTATFLVFDLPTSVVSVSADLMKKWKKPVDELISIGLQNVRTAYPTERTRVSLGETEIIAYASDHPYATCWALMPETHQDLYAECGLLFGIPTSRHFVICPADRERALTAALDILPLVEQLHEEGPHSLSPLLYWRFEDRIFPMRLKKDDEGARLILPEDLHEYLKKWGYSD